MIISLFFGLKTIKEVFREEFLVCDCDELYYEFLEIGKE